MYWNWHQLQFFKLQHSLSTLNKVIQHARFFLKHLKVRCQTLRMYCRISLPLNFWSFYFIPNGEFLGKSAKVCWLKRSSVVIPQNCGRLFWAEKRFYIAKEAIIFTIILIWQDCVRHSTLITKPAVQPSNLERILFAE